MGEVVSVVLLSLRILNFLSHTNGQEVWNLHASTFDSAMDRWDGADDDTELINKKRHQQGQGRTDNRFMSSSAAAAAGAPGLGGFVRSCTNEVSNGGSME